MRRIASHGLAALASGVAAILALAGLAGCAPSLAPGTRECVGFPAAVCQSRAADLEQEGQTRGGVAGYRFVCTSAPCTAARGEGTETVVFGDGTRREAGFGYASPADAPAAVDPPLTVTPQCVGVPESWCTEFARSAGAEVGRDGGTVAAITVACTSTCTETDGKGATSVTMTDGKVLQYGWEYQTSPVSGGNGSGPAEVPQGGEP